MARTALSLSQANGEKHQGKIKLLATVTFASAILLASACGGTAGSSGYDESASGGEQYEPADTGEGTTDEGTLYLLVQRVNPWASPPTSLECYTFYADGLVELRHSGNREVSDFGEYSGDAEGGEIAWNSGRVSRVVWQGDKYTIDSEVAAEVDSC